MPSGLCPPKQLLAHLGAVCHRQEPQRVVAVPLSRQQILVAPGPTVTPSCPGTEANKGCELGRSRQSQRDAVPCGDCPSTPSPHGHLWWGAKPETRQQAGPMSQPAGCGWRVSRGTFITLYGYLKIKRLKVKCLKLQFQKLKNQLQQGCQTHFHRGSHQALQLPSKGRM